MIGDNILVPKLYIRPLQACEPTGITFKNVVLEWGSHGRIVPDSTYRMSEI